MLTVARILNRMERTYMGEVISFAEIVKRKGSFLAESKEPTYEISIKTHGKHGAHVTVTKREGGPFSLYMSDYVTSWFDVEKKAKKCAERMVKNWKKQDAEEITII